MVSNAAEYTGGIESMKRVLIVSYHTPPRDGIAAIRTGQLVRGLPRLGWDIGVLTVDLGDVHFDDARIRATPVADVKGGMKRMLGLRPGQGTHEQLGLPRTLVGRRGLRQRAIVVGYEYGEFANRTLAWIVPGVRAARNMLREQRYDAVISTSPPESAHLIASLVRGDLPWIADLRDPWRRDGFRSRPEPLGTLDRSLERLVLRKASVVTIVSEPLRQAMTPRFPSVRIESVPNAFSAEEWRDVPFTRSDRCVFAYAGQLHSGRRDPTLLFETVSAMLADGSLAPEALRIDFYGASGEWLDDLVSRCGLRQIVRLHGRIAREQILQLERAADALLLFLWNDPDERGTYTGKLFEYLGARRPIIASGGPRESVIDDVLARTGAGTRAQTPGQMRAAIAKAVAAHAAGNVGPLDPTRAAPFESAALVKRFASLLDECAAR
jgi:glycosyltransferase involved in cell wall biosynthesis